MKTLLLLPLLLVMQSCVPKGSGESLVAGHSETPGNGDDPLANYAWHLENTGQSSFSGSAGVSGQDMKIKPVIDSGIKGNGIRIAVSDTGVETDHPDLEGNQLYGEHRNYSGPSSYSWHNSSPAPEEGEGHGTSVTGIIAALGWNAIGSRGVAPLAKFAGFYFLGDFNDTTSSYEAKYIDQLSGNFDIFNYSYGYPGCKFIPASTSVIAAFQAGITNIRNGRGAIYVKAAGNDFTTTSSDCYPAPLNYIYGNTNTSEDQTHPYVILTAAVNAKGKKSSYSTPGSGVWISGTGGEYGDTEPAIITTDMQSCSEGLSKSSSTENNFNRGAHNLNRYCNYTNIMNGTSAATPSISGVVALMLEANPNLTWRDVKHILAMTASKVDFSTATLSHPKTSLNLTGHTYDKNYTTNRAGISFSNSYGFGRANAEAAVNMAKTYVAGSLGTYRETLNPNTDAWFYQSGTINQVIPDFISTGVSHGINVLHNYQIESVQVKISTDHTWVGDLGVELTSPGGTVSRLLLINSGIRDAGLIDQVLLSNAFYGESSLGEWKIKVIDGSASDVGVLQSWKIKINGRTVASDGTPPNGITGITHALTSTSLTESPQIDFTTAPATDVVRYEVRITTVDGIDKAKWYSIGKTTSFTTKNLFLTRGQAYTISIRAIDNTETASAVLSSSWTVN